jgi:hypothetical protein
LAEIFLFAGKNLWISAVGYSADSESVLSDTALILISIVGYSADSESALYPTALIASKEKLLGKNIPLKTDISVVRYSAYSESALYDTALIHEYSTDSIFKF